MLRIRDILVQVPDPDPASDLAIFVSDLQEGIKNVFASYFLKLYFHNFSKIKSPEKVTEQ